MRTQKDRTTLTIDVLYRIKAEGRLNEKQKSLLERMEATEADITNPNNYKMSFKNRCVRCYGDIPATWENYSMRGNYCTSCASYFSRLMQGKGV